MTTLQKQSPSIRSHLQSDQFRDEIAKVLPSHLTPDRMARVAITALTRTPKLADCTQASFFRCLLDLSMWGLEPDGRRAHLIPYGKECTLIIDYKGIVELAMRSGTVKKIHADVVCENDVFEYDRGEIVRHSIGFRQPRGDVYAVYALAVMHDGVEKCEVLSLDEIEAIRKRSKAGNGGPWVSDWNEMAKKTAFRRLSKWLPLNAEIRDAFTADDRQFHEPHRPHVFDAQSRPAIDQLTDQLSKVPDTEQAPPTPWSDKIEAESEHEKLIELAAEIDADDSVPKAEKAKLAKAIQAKLKK